jgi:hypothetical protein
VGRRSLTLWHPLMTLNYAGTFLMLPVFPVEILS